MQRINRYTTQRTISSLIGESAEHTYKLFEPRREHNEATAADIRIPEHQRFYVWSTKLQEGLIESVMENCPVPLIVFTEQVVGNKIVLFIQDGQQRLMTFQKYLLGEFKWNNKFFEQLDAEERRNFFSYSLTCEVVRNPTADQVADIFDRLNSGKPLTDNDKFWNRRESPVVKFVLRELVDHPELKEYFRKYSSLNFTSKTRGQLANLVGAVVAIIHNSVSFIRTSFDRVGHKLYEPVTEEQKRKVVDILKLYFRTVAAGLQNTSYENKPKKLYVKLSHMLGIWLYWRLHDTEHYAKKSAIPDHIELNQDCTKWLWFAEQVQVKDKIKNIFSSLAAGHQRNLAVDALDARTVHLMSIDISDYQDYEDNDSDDDEDDSEESSVNTGSDDDNDEN